MSIIESSKLFSIILATYNCGEKVRASIKSILSQNKDLFELIVIDGASTDNTLEIVKEYAGELTLFSERDNGVYDAFNKGIDLAAGKYLYFIGAGDCLREGILETVKDYLMSADRPDLIYGNAFVVKDKHDYRGGFNRVRLRIENFCHQAAFYHRRIFKLIGKYECRYKIFADWALNLKCFSDWRIVMQHIDCVIVDFEGGGLSSTAGDPNFKADFSNLTRKHLGTRAYLANRIPPAIPVLYRRISDSLITYIADARRRK